MASLDELHDSSSGNGFGDGHDAEETVRGNDAARCLVTQAISFGEHESIVHSDCNGKTGDRVCGDVGVNIGVDNLQVGGLHSDVLPYRSVTIALSDIVATDNLELVTLIIVVVKLVLVCGTGHPVPCEPGTRWRFIPDGDVVVDVVDLIAVDEGQPVA